MEFLYPLINHVRENMPQLSLVDEDYGQLEALDRDDADMYPVTFPAVLVNMLETEWSCLEGRSQKGTATLVFKLAVDCYDDTHHGSGTTEAILRRAETVGGLHLLLQGFRPFGRGGMTRTRSRFRTWSHGIKVYETTYTVPVEDIIPETTTDPAPRKVSISAGRLSRQP